MRYLGIVKRQGGHLSFPDAFRDEVGQPTYEAIEVGGDILLLSSPLDQQRLQWIERLAGRSIEEHRQALEGLAR